MRNIEQAERAEAFLKEKHPWLYTDMTEPLRLGTADQLYMIEDAVIIKTGGSWIWAPFTDDAQIRSAELVNSLKGEEDGLCLHFYRNPVESRRILGMKNILTPAYLAVHPSKKELEIETDAVFRRLTHEYDEFVFRTYRMAQYFTDGLQFVHEAVQRGMTGAFVDGKIAGFIGVHPEGSLGMLEILPEFRRRGYGKALEQYGINALIREGKIPYCHILEDNAASLALERALGYNISETSCIYWLN